MFIRRRQFARGAVTSQDSAATAISVNAPPTPPSLPEGGSITDVPGLRVGHYTLKERPTGCTVILCEKGATAGVDVRGSAPGTRETDLLSPVNTIDKVNGILLSGGSAYGLNAAAGVMRYLEEHQDGYAIAGGVVPIVPAAVLMDLEIGDFKFRPDAESGYNACLLATSGPVVEGCVGAGAGATVGKMFGGEYMMKSGLGSASIRIADTDVVVGAIVAVNSLGDVLDPRTGRILAGARNADGKGYRDTMAQLLKGEAVSGNCGANTTIGVVATNVPLTKTQLTKVAQMSHDGYARAINPVHTMEDGDTIFALSTGTAHGRPNVTTIGAIAATVMARAIVRAVMQATSVPELNLLACRDY